MELSIPRYLSPFRYPGGKARLAKYFRELYDSNDLVGAEYVEPYAGGASVGLFLLFNDSAPRIHINDYSLPIYAFWHSVLHETKALCRRIRCADLTIAEYRKQKEVLRRPSQASLLELGFAAFFVNRTSRSGIMSDRSGPIGGENQEGKWHLDARYNAEALTERIALIASKRDRISLYNLDAEVLLRTVSSRLPARTLVYLDPPYFRKGQRLYTNAYSPADHAVVAARVLRLQQHWVVSYDDCRAVRRLYAGQGFATYRIAYTAAERYKGREVLFFSNQLQAPVTRRFSPRPNVESFTARRTRRVAV